MEQPTLSHIKSLPFEVKSIIYKKVKEIVLLQPSKFITFQSQSVPPEIGAIIDEYIETRLLKDLVQTCFLYNTTLYNQAIHEKLQSMSSMFICALQNNLHLITSRDSYGYPSPPNGTVLISLSLNIKYSKHYELSHNDFHIIHSFTGNLPLYNYNPQAVEEMLQLKIYKRHEYQMMLHVPGNCCREETFNPQYIRAELFHILLSHIKNRSIQIKSIELVKEINVVNSANYMGADYSEEVLEKFM